MRHTMWFALALCLIAPIAQSGCARSEAVARDGSSLDGVDFEEFPTHDAVLSAMDAFDADPTSSRASDPVSLSQFFGEPIKTLNSQGNDMLIELVWPDRSLADKPVALLHARFGTSAINWIGRSFDESTWNDRFRDVQLMRGSGSRDQNGTAAQLVTAGCADGDTRYARIAVPRQGTRSAFT